MRNANFSFWPPAVGASARSQLGPLCVSYGMVRWDLIGDRLAKFTSIDIINI